MSEDYERLAATIGALAFMLSSLWATLRVTFVGLPEGAPAENAAEEQRADARSWHRGTAFGVPSLRTSDKIP